MKVRAIWEFDADVSDLDPKFVDITGFAKYVAEVELKYLLRHNKLTVDEFEFSVVIE